MMAWMGNVPHRLTYVNIGLELGMVFRGSRGIFGVGGVTFWSGSPGSDLWELPSPYSSPPPLHSRICHKREGEQLLRAPAAMLLHCDGFSAVVGFPLNNPPLTKLLLLVFLSQCQEKSSTYLTHYTTRIWYLGYYVTNGRVAHSARDAGWREESQVDGTGGSAPHQTIQVRHSCNF